MNKHENGNTQVVENGVAFDPLLGFFKLPHIETTTVANKQDASDAKVISDPHPMVSTSEYRFLRRYRVGWQVEALHR
jgi:hypothetical protein